MTFKLMSEIYNPACQPPWSDSDLKVIIDSAARNGTSPIGAHASAPAAEVFANANLPPPKPAPAAPSWFLSAADQASLPDPKWLVKDVLIENKVALLVAPKGQFKTFLALDLALAIATGSETFGSKPESTGLVFYGDHESTQEIAKLHRPAWQVLHGLGPDEETGFYLSKDGPHFSFILPDGKREIDSFADDIARIAEREKKPVKLIVFDTYSATMLGLDENDPNTGNNFIKYCRSLIKAFNCTILIVAHSGKDVTMGTRGSSAFPFGVDTILGAERVDDTNMVKLRVLNHRGFAERKAPFFLEGRPFAKSLVFHLLSQEEHQALDAGTNEFSRKAIGALLQSCGAVDDTNTMTTHAMAAAMRVQEENESEDRYLARLRDAELRLRRLSKKTLTGFNFGEGAKMRWCLPKDATEQPARKSDNA